MVMILCVLFCLFRGVWLKVVVVVGGWLANCRPEDEEIKQRFAIRAAAKDIEFDQRSRAAMQAGRNVILDEYGAPKVVNDGVPIARAIELPDAMENAGAALIRKNCKAEESKLNFLSHHHNLIKKDFKEGHTGILVATDLTDIRIDAKGVNIVISYDMPVSADNYLLRLGRAGRIETKVLLIAFVASAGDSFVLIQVPKIFEVDIKELPKHIDTRTYEYLEKMYGAETAFDLRRKENNELAVQVNGLAIHKVMLVFYQKPFVLNPVAYPILNSGSMRILFAYPGKINPTKTRVLYLLVPLLLHQEVGLYIVDFVRLPWQNQSNQSSGIFSSDLGNSGINAATHSLDPEDMGPSSVKLLSGSSVHSGMGGIGSHNFENEVVLSSFSSVSAPELHIPEFMIDNDAREAEICLSLVRFSESFLDALAEMRLPQLLLKRSLKVCMRMHQIQLVSVLILLCQLQFVKNVHNIWQTLFSGLEL